VSNEEDSSNFFKIGKANAFFFQRALTAVAVGVWRAGKTLFFLISNQEDTR
jgi:hypothetical protein